MGMSASQARLLTLTARLSDLELQAQQISNSKIRLSMQSEQVATDYSAALDKEEMSIISGYNSSGTAEYESLTYDNLTGVDSPLTTQYCLSDTNGNVLVTQDEADAFKQSKDADDFCDLMGAGPTTTYATGVTASSYQAAEDAVNSAYAAYETSEAAVTSTETALNTYGSTHVKGYEGDGTWSYNVASGTTFATAYSDSDVFSYLQENGSTYTDQWEEYDGDSSKANISYSSASGASPVCFYYEDNHTGTVASNLTSLVSSVSSDTTKAALAVLKEEYSSSDYEKIQSQLTSAAATATQQTQSFYSSQLNNTQNYTGKDKNNTVTIAYTAGTNQVWDDTHGCSEYYVDLNQVAKTFLAYFDAACAGINGDSSTSTACSSEVSSSYTDRDSVGGTGSSDSVTTTYKNYNSTDNSGSIQYLTSGDETTAAVTSNYQSYLTAYENALSTESAAKTKYDAAETALAALGTPTVTASENSSYYTNLYNRMCDGYITMDDESSTIDSSAWVQSQMQAGNLVLEKCTKDDSGNTSWASTSWSSDSDIKEATDDTDTAKAEAKYEADSAKIQTKDKEFDLELQNINTEHNAVQTEFESVQKVIEKNIERSFKLFNA